MGRCLQQLVCHPGVGWLGGDAKVNHSPRTEFNNEEGVNLPEEQVDDWEKVTGPDQRGVILEEGWPILTVGGVRACQADACPLDLPQGRQERQASVLLDRRPPACGLGRLAM